MQRLASQATYILFNAVIAGIYFAAAQFGFFFLGEHPVATIIWLPTALAVSSFILFGPRLTPGIFLGAFFANWVALDSILPCLFIATGNTLESVFAGLLIRRFANGERAFENVGSYMKCTLAFLAAPIISATIGANTLVLAGYSDASQFVSLWLVWWLGDSVSAILFVPLIVSWFSRFKPSLSTLERMEYGLLLLGVSFTSTIVHFSVIPLEASRILGVATLPIIAFIALRFSIRETSLAVALLFFMALYWTVQGEGPLMESTLELSMIRLTSAFATIGFMFYLLVIGSTAHRRTSEALAQASRSKDEFLALMAHEIRNPLAPVVSYLELLQFPDTTEAERKNAMDGMRHSINRLTRLIEDLLDIARAASGKLTMYKKRVELDPIVDSAIQSLSIYFQKSNMNIMVRHSKEPLTIYADPIRIEQILINLLHNAIKFSDSGSTIMITVARHGEEAKITVHDSGIGIEPENLARMFDMFVQGDQAAGNPRTYGGGMGVGLRLVKQFAELHNGRVDAESKGRGKGSTFTVYLPLAKKHEGKDDLRT